MDRIDDRPFTEQDEAMLVSATRYIARALHWTKANCEKHAAMGFADGWSKAFDQLVETARTL